MRFIKISALGSALRNVVRTFGSAAIWQAIRQA
jgi:hypothetical protein